MVAPWVDMEEWEEIPPALTCPECGAEMVLRNSRFGKFYGCRRWPDCKATHGAHEDGAPLGVPADGRTRLARVRAHEALDVLWKTRQMSRRDAYLWLQKVMLKSKEDAHIGKFTAAECKQVEQEVTLFMTGEWVEE